MADDPRAYLLATGALMLNKILGPTADAMGQGIKNWSEQRYQNLVHIFANAAGKIGEEDAAHASFPPGIVERIIDEGSRKSDAVATEYLGSILASSQGGVRRDDRGAAMVSLVSRLSVYELRTHYVFYSVAHKVLQGRSVRFGFPASRSSNRVLIPAMQYIRAMAFEDGEEIDVLITHVLHTLSRENLIDTFVSGDPDAMREFGEPNCPGAALAFQTSVLGVELFLWVHGLSDTSINRFLETSERFALDLPIAIPENASVVGELPPLSDEFKFGMQFILQKAAERLRDGPPFPEYPRPTGPG